ncbi:MAG: hypothetical protein KAU94_09105, partial [Verrucomicrobia bacterium]|nr:hypothetical protein [Verrucomicrobiota bacterium]
KSVPLPADHPVSEIVKSAAHTMGMKYAPLVWTSKHIKEMQTTGVIHPAILVPASFEAFTPEQQAMILRHELAHIQRGDVAVRLLLEGIMTVFWFHPLIWILLRRCDQTTEMACDDAVLHDGHSASAYAETLLAPSRQAHTKSAVAAVRHRIASIINPKKQRLPLTAKSTIGFSLLFLVLLLPPALVSFTPYPAAPPFEPENGNDDLRGLWKMSLNRGTILPDWSGNNRHGKIFGARWITDPEKGACLSFDGIDDRLVLRAPDAEWTAKPFTFCIWLKPDANSDGGGLLLKGDLNNLWSEASGDTYRSQSRLIVNEKEIFLGGGDYREGEERERHDGLHLSLNYYNQAIHRSATPLTPSQWTHVALVWNPAADHIDSRIYLNGQPIETEQLINVGQISDWPAQVWYFGHGESTVTRNNHYEGLAADLAIYQKALSREEVENVMNGVFSFGFGSGTNSNAHDSVTTVRDTSMVDDSNHADPSGTFTLLPRRAKTTNRIRLENSDATGEQQHLAYWEDPSGTVTWTLASKMAGTFDVYAHIAAPKPSEGSVIEFVAGAQILPLTIHATGTWQEFTEVKVGTLRIPSGKTELTVRIKSVNGEAPCNLGTVRLVPSRK